jgi:gliding motility-associated-like protein
MLHCLRTCFRCFVIALFLLVCSPAVVAQVVELDACQGNLERCITPADTLYEMCFNVKPSTTCAFAKFDMDWDDGTKETFNKPGPIQIKHTYDLRSYLKNCGSGTVKQFKIFIVTDCPGDNKGVILTFKIKPRVDFSNPDICAGQSVFFSNKTCPNSSDVKWLWTFGDGTTSANASVSKTYPASTPAGTVYPVSLSATNSCGSDIKTVNVPVLRTPTAKYNTTGYTIAAPGDTVVCLNNGGTLTLDGTVSIDESRYQWSISPSSFSLVGGTNSQSGVVKVLFRQAGTYTITLTAINDCGNSAPIICTHRVVDVPTLTIPQQPGACEPIKYKLPSTLNPSATYTFNNQPIVPGQEVDAPISNTPYVVKGELKNQCSTFPTTMTFSVQAPAAVQITTPFRQTAVCVNSARLALPVSATGGSWTGSGANLVQTTGGNYFFNPSTTGQYSLTYSRGSGACSQADAIQINVASVPKVTISPQANACQNIIYTLQTTTPTATFTLNGQPILPNTPISLSLSATPYVVRGEIASNECVTTPESISFTVQAPVPLQITVPGAATAVCVGSARFAVQVSPATGAWTGSGQPFLETSGGNTFFNPRTTGQYQLVYSRGSGDCLTTDVISISVDGGSVTAQNASVCQSLTALKLQGTPAGGIWRSVAFPNAVRNDTLFLAGITANTVALTYSLNFGTAGCPALANATISIGRPKAAFSIGGTCSASAITLQNTSTGASSYQWAVNGANVSTAETPTLTLPPGQNRILLTVGAGACSDTTSRTLKLIAAPAPITFVPSQSSACAPVSVSFSVTGAANADVQYTWNYGNGQTSTAFAPVGQTYRNQTRQPIVFPVSVSARNACGVQSFSSTVMARPLAKAEIGIDSTTFRCSPARVKFSNRSTGQTTPSVWSWGDGSPSQTTTADTLSHLFSARDSTRTYRIILNVSGDCGRDADTVSVKIAPTLVRALFTIGNPTPCPGEAVTFTDASTPKPDRVIWRFSDGTGSVATNPQKAFANPNTTYTISLTALTTCGYDSTRKTIRTTVAPVGNFSVAAPFTCAGQVLQFQNLSNPVNRFRWDFGDGTALDSVNLSPVHTYVQGGNRTVSLTVFGVSLACKTVVTKPVEIRDKVKADFSVEGAADLCAPGVVRLVGSAGNANAWQWSLSDGRTFTGQSVEVPVVMGQFDVSLVASYNSNGQAVCRDSVGRRGIIRVTSCEVYAPDAFTPNGDKVGDLWTLFGEGIVQINLLRIRSRWGEVIFEGNDFLANSQQPGQGWDGTFNGVPMPPGQYTYEAMLTLKGNREERHTGTVTLIR